MRISFPLFVLAIVLAVVSCQSKPSSSDPRANQPEEFKKLLDSHGDWSKWIEAQAFSFAMIHETTLAMENHYINLADRKVRIDADAWQIGNDGEKIWISPSLEAFQGNSVPFYHNLYFHLFSIPYRFTEPGATVKKTENKRVNGQSYEALEVAFDANVGDSPGDSYFMLIDPETGRLAWLLYKVTFFDKSNPQMNALKYEDYREVDGLAFPRLMTGYQYVNDSTKQISYQVSFSDIFLVDEPIDDGLFAMPETGAVEVAN